MRRLGVLTTDFALYHDLVRYLRDHGISFESLAFGEIPGPEVGVVVTSWRDVHRSDLPVQLPVVPVSIDASGREDVAGAVTQALRALEGVPGYHELVVGIDPGKRPGIAFLGDGRIIHTAQTMAAAEVAPLLRGLLPQFPSDRVVVRLGQGAPRERDAILYEVLGWQDPALRIELVDETGTTPRPGRQRAWSPDVAAAVEIARTPGRGAPRPRPFVSPGQIREIQRESRELSGGRRTISRDLARRVARGDLGLREALDEEESRRRRKSRSSRTRES